MKTRHDMYRNVHKGLRRELSALLACAGSADPRDESELGEVAQGWRELESLLHAHHQHEDAHIGPHLRRIAPALLAEMEQDHVALDREIAALSLTAERLARQAESAAVARAFYLDLAGFMSRYFAHMEREERVYVLALQGAYSDAELDAIENGLVASIEPQLLSRFFAAMLPAMNQVEREALLAGIRENAPPPVFSGMCELAKSALPAPTWLRLKARLFAAHKEAVHV